MHVAAVYLCVLISTKREQTLKRFLYTVYRIMSKTLHKAKFLRTLALPRDLQLFAWSRGAWVETRKVGRGMAFQVRMRGGGFVLRVRRFIGCCKGFVDWVLSRVRKWEAAVARRRMVMRVSRVLGAVKWGISVWLRGSTRVTMSAVESAKAWRRAEREKALYARDYEYHNFPPGWHARTAYPHRGKYRFVSDPDSPAELARRQRLWVALRVEVRREAWQIFRRIEWENRVESSRYHVGVMDDDELELLGGYGSD